MENTFIYSIKSTASLTSLAYNMTNTYIPMKLKIIFYSILSILLFSNCEKNKEHSVKANYLDFLNVMINLLAV
jgi:hypothetical protein